MKTLFIPAKIRFSLDKSKILKISKKLPKNIAIAYSIQYKDYAFEINKILSEKHKVVKTVQVLGCSKPVFSKNVQAILLIGSGKFHSVSLTLETGLPVYVLENDLFRKVDSKEIALMKKRQKAAYMNFLNSKKVGIMVSTKPGQERLNKAIELKKKLRDKKSYLFIENNLNPEEFENFGLNCWINTACPRMDLESNKVINMDKIKL